jgi:predicted ATP-dependent endonuclease of OLD family
VLLDAHENRLVIHVKSGQGASMRFRERSDGLRQFVALFALTADERYSVPPILLIDEVEQHLHYDAQADLLRVLHAQTLTSQVIYSTHSAACLPEDLGASMRVVAGIGDEMRSEIRSAFWTEDPGLGALLLALGASSLALVPIRPAVIAEGPSELVLLPSLLKEAIGADSLGYSVVPGASNAPPTRIAGIDLAGVATVWVLDGDQGGKNRKAFLVKNAVPGSRILLLESGHQPLDLEDLIDRETYVAAINEWLDDVGAQRKFGVNDLPSATCGRHKSVENWCKRSGLKPPGKTLVANKVLAFRGHRPLVSPNRRATLRGLNRRIVDLLYQERDDRMKGA